MALLFLPEAGWPQVGPSWGFNVAAHGAASFTSSGCANLTTGYTTIQAGSFANGLELPDGFTLIGNREDGALVSEAAVQAQALVSSGRYYAEVAGPVNTGIAIANPNGQPVTITFYFTDANGTDFGQGSTTIAANSQISTFVSQSPFNAPANFQGTFTFQSSLLISVMAMRIFQNERGEFLMSTMPSANELLRPTFYSQYEVTPIQTIPQFRDGGGWTTTILIVNSGDSTITGSLQAYTEGPGDLPRAGTPLNITLSGVTGSVFQYAIPAHSFARFESGGGSTNTTSGVIDILPGTGSVTASFVLFRHQTQGVTINETIMPASLQASAWDIYVEYIGDFADAASGSVQTAVTVASGYQTAFSNVLPGFGLELYSSNGQLLGQAGDFYVSSPGEATFVLNQIPGLPQVTPPFRGILRVVVDPFARVNPHGARATGVRSHYNERGELLVTAIPALPEPFGKPSSELMFPQFAVGEGFETDFVLFSETGAAGTMYVFDTSGNPVSLPAEATSVSSIEGR